MKKLTIGLSLAALAFSGAAYAQQDTRPKLDGDGDGVVTRAEAEAHSTRMFARMDVNGDGKIDQADREARRTQRFDRMDTNKDGQISREEFANVRRGGGDKTEAKAKAGNRHHKRGHRGGGKMMRMADTNNDGVISQAEFTAAALKHFDTMDANKDGRVTKEERQAAYAQMRAKWQERKAGTGTPGN